MCKAPLVVGIVLKRSTLITNFSKVSRTTVIKEPRRCGCDADLQSGKSSSAGSLCDVERSRVCTTKSAKAKLTKSSRTYGNVANANRRMEYGREFSCGLTPTDSCSSCCSPMYFGSSVYMLQEVGDERQQYLGLEKSRRP